VLDPVVGRRIERVIQILVAVPRITSVDWGTRVGKRRSLKVSHRIAKDVPDIIEENVIILIWAC